jgi:hypothetical protein
MASSKLFYLTNKKMPKPRKKISSKKLTENNEKLKITTPQEIYFMKLRKHLIKNEKNKQITKKEKRGKNKQTNNNKQTTNREVYLMQLRMEMFQLYNIWFHKKLMEILHVLIRKRHVCLQQPKKDI